MASAGGDKATVWDFSSSPNGSIPVATVGHRSTITALAWQPDGGLLATAGKDGLVMVYELEDVMEGKPRLCLPAAMALVPGGEEITSLVWASDGVLYTGDVGGRVRKWQLPLAAAED